MVHVRMSVLGERTIIRNKIVGAAVLRFFDKHLSGRDTTIDNEKPVHYYTMGEEKWRAADKWPPLTDDLTLYSAPSGALATTPPSEDGIDSIKAITPAVQVCTHATTGFIFKMWKPITTIGTAEKTKC